LSPASLFFSLTLVIKDRLRFKHLLYDAEGMGNITRAHGRNGQSDIESIPLANQDEWHKIVAIETF
jgi:hypothetical protein